MTCQTCQNEDSTSTASTVTAKPHDYRPDIDGLRAISILAVLGYHAFPRLLPGGSVGVDVFFVISGYLITGIILKGLQNGRFSYLVFYSRRIRRIFPALGLVLVACLICGWLFLFPEEWRQLGKHVFGGAAFISNLLFMREGGYFAAAAASKPLLHLWSLGIEEQFYITWPLFLALMWKRPKRILPFIIAFACLSFLANVAYLGRHQNEVFYFPLTRYLELLIGAFLAAQAHLRRFESSGRPFRLGRVASSAILASIGVALLLGAIAIARENAFPGYVALLPTGAAFCLIAAGPDAWFNRVVLSRPWMVFIGLISYPLYLWHWPVLVFTHLVSAVRWPATVLALLTSLALSSLTYKFLELPIRKIRSGVTVTVWLALFVGIGGMVGLLANRRAIVARLSTPMDQGVEAALDDWKYPFGGNFKAAGRYQAGILKGSNGGQVVFIGDSHMEQYYPRVKLLSSLRGTGDFPTSVFITSEGCPPLPGVNQVSPGYTCDSFFAFASQYAQRPDVRTVVFGAYWEAYFGHRYDARPGELASAQLYRTGDANRDPLVLAAASTEVMFQDFEESMRVLVGQGKDVFVLLSNPTGVAYDPTSMISRLTNTVRRRDVNRDNFVEAVRPVIDRIRMAAVRAGATVIDPLPYLCGGAVCRTTTHDGLPRYLDRDHLRSSYAADAAVFIDQVLEPARATASGN